MKIGIAHRNIVSRDAVGNDILGMHKALRSAGFDVELIGEYFDSETSRQADVTFLGSDGIGDDLSALIYHHSIFWPQGEAMLRDFRAPTLLKYHNVTPARFFAAYSADHQQQCSGGRAQTERLVRLCERRGFLAADSAYNAAELAAAGAVGKIAVAPPFTHVERIGCRQRPTAPPYRVLFVGRLAPNKGHLALLTTISAYVATFGPQIELTIVGGFDRDLANYKAVVEREIDRLGLRRQVILLESLGDDALWRLYRRADAFLCLSEHEGFCVPIVEAQAAGVPVVSVGVCALTETIGAGQLVVEPPREPEDFFYLARLLHAACADEPLRRQLIAAGHHNVERRFLPAQVADRFMAALARVLEFAD